MHKDINYLNRMVLKRIGKEPRLRELSLLGLFGALIFLTDQSIKDKIDESPKESFPRPMKGKLKDVAVIDRYKNEGFALGRLKEDKELVKRVTAAGTATVFTEWLCLFFEKGGHLKKLGLAMASAGAASNLYDRIKRGYVIDYLIIKKEPLSRIVINLGDAAIFAGSFAAFLGELLKPPKR